MAREAHKHLTHLIRPGGGLELPLPTQANAAIASQASRAAADSPAARPSATVGNAQIIV